MYKFEEVKCFTRIKIVKRPFLAYCIKEVKREIRSLVFACRYWRWKFTVKVHTRCVVCSGLTLVVILELRLFVGISYCISLIIAVGRLYVDVAIFGCVGSLLFFSGRLLRSTYYCRRLKVVLGLIRWVAVDYWFTWFTWGWSLQTETCRPIIWTRTICDIICCVRRFLLLTRLRRVQKL
jgi:hypothetical protein